MKSISSNLTAAEVQSWAESFERLMSSLSKLWFIRKVTIHHRINLMMASILKRVVSRAQPNIINRS